MFLFTGGSAYHSQDGCQAWKNEVPMISAAQGLLILAYRTFMPMSADELIRHPAPAEVAIRAKGPCWWNPE